jgi:hypothetical protein
MSHDVTPQPARNAAIRAAVAAGRSRRDVAREFGISAARVTAIVQAASSPAPAARRAQAAQLPEPAPPADITAAIAAGAITSDKIATNAITAGKIAAGAIDGTTITGALVRTASGTSRVELNSSTNDLAVYVSGTKVGRLGGTVASGLLEITGSFTSTYPAYFENTSTAGGAVKIVSVGGYALEISQSSSTSGYYGAVIRNTTGGFGAIGQSSGGGGKAFVAISGGYAPFTGCHDGFVLKTETIAEGDIVCDGDLVEREIMDVITKVSRCTLAGQANPIGVYVRRYAMNDHCIPPSMLLDDLVTPKSSWAGLKADYEIAVFNGTGEGSVNVCGRNGDIAKGDLIETSTLTGKGQKAADNLVRNTTVARAREGVTFAHPDDVHLIACVYMCG